VSVEDAIEVLRQNAGSVALDGAARRLDVSPRWIRDHLELFPNAWRLTAGCAGERNVGELRIPVSDLMAYEDSRRIFRKA
jgi:hypothetical protein